MNDVRMRLCDVCNWWKVWIGVEKGMWKREMTVGQVEAMCVSVLALGGK